MTIIVKHKIRIRERKVTGPIAFRIVRASVKLRNDRIFDNLDWTTMTPAEMRAEIHRRLAK